MENLTIPFIGEIPLFTRKKKGILGKKPQEVKAVIVKEHCGVGVLATMHAGSLLEYQQKREWEPLLEKCHFRRLLWIDKKSGRRQFFLYDEAGELLCVKESA